jgi:hypothetical protein
MEIACILFLADDTCNVGSIANVDMIPSPRNKINIDRRET